jgi:hypothetical protein
VYFKWLTGSRGKCESLQTASASLLYIRKMRVLIQLQRAMEYVRNDADMLNKLLMS